MKLATIEVFWFSQLTNVGFTSPPQRLTEGVMLWLIYYNIRYILKLGMVVSPRSPDALHCVWWAFASVTLSIRGTCLWPGVQLRRWWPEPNRGCGDYCVWRWRKQREPLGQYLLDSTEILVEHFEVRKRAEHMLTLVFTVHREMKNPRGSHHVCFLLVLRPFQYQTCFSKEYII